MTDFLSEEELQNLTPQQLAQEANKYIYQDSITERKEEYPILKWAKIKRIKRREILMPNEELRKLAHGEHIDPLFFQKKWYNK